MAKTVGATIRNARERLDLTQAEAAKLAGLSPPAFNRLEHGKGQPRWDTMVRVARAFGLTLDELNAGTVERASAAAAVPNSVVRAELRAAKRDLLALARRIADLEERLGAARRPVRRSPKS